MWSPRDSRRRERRERRERSLAAQILLLQLAVVAVVLAIVAAISLHQSTQRFAADRGSRMSSVAEYVANLGVVRSQLDQARTSSVVADALPRTLAPYVDRALNLSGAGDVAIAAPDGTVLTATDPSRAGTQARLGDSDVQQGRGWTGRIEGPGGPVVAGHAPVIADDGQLVGLVLAEQSYPTVWERVSDTASDLLLFLGLGALLGGVGTWIVSRVLKRRSRGLAPREIATLADHREALLHSIREGVIAVDNDGRVTTANDAAVETLGLTGDPVGRRVDELGLDRRVADLLGGTDVEVQDAVAVVGERVVVLNRRTASAGGRGIGSVTTLRDRTELVSLQGQLSSNLSITDTLRAQTHEFSNQLHTISGLVQLREYDELSALVGALTRRRAAITDEVTGRVRDPGVAALLVAKWSAAAERRVRLRLHDDSALPRLAPGTAADLTTVLGNLVDNAVDACAGPDGPDDAVVEVEVEQVGETVRCVVRDSGPGVPEDLREAIFVRGFSTKPDVLGGRGIGLPLVQLICTRSGGSVAVGRSEALGGAEFTVVLLPAEVAV